MPRITTFVDATVIVEPNDGEDAGDFAGQAFDELAKKHGIKGSPNSFKAPDGTITISATDSKIEEK